MKIEFDVSDAAGGFAVGLGALVSDCKKALADGFQIGGDSGAILASVLTNLIPQIAKMSEIEEAAKADVSGLSLAIAVELKKAL